MSDKEKRRVRSKAISCYPERNATATIGSTSRDINEAVEVLSTLLATQDAFFDPAKSDKSGWTHRHWSCLAAGLRKYEPSPQNLAMSMSLAIFFENNARRINLGAKYFADDGMDRDIEIAAIKERLTRLTLLQAWYVHTAVKFVWEFYEYIKRPDAPQYKENVALDEQSWWLVSFRRSFMEKMDADLPGEVRVSSDGELAS